MPTLGDPAATSPLVTGIAGTQKPLFGGNFGLTGGRRTRAAGSIHGLPRRPGEPGTWRRRAPAEPRGGSGTGRGWANARRVVRGPAWRAARVQHSSSCRPPGPVRPAATHAETADMCGDNGASDRADRSSYSAGRMWIVLRP